MRCHVGITAASLLLMLGHLPAAASLRVRFACRASRVGVAPRRSAQVFLHARAHRLPPPPSSLQENEQVDLPGRIMGQYLVWGAAAGASLDLSVNLTGWPPDRLRSFAWVILADDGDFNAILRTPGDVCAPDFTVPAPLAVRMGNPSNASSNTLNVSWSATSQSASLWHFLFFS